MNLRKYTLTLITIGLGLLSALAQSGEIRGFVYDKTTAEPLAFTTVYIQGTQNVAITDLTGFFTLSKIKPGNYVLLATSLGYDTSSYNFTITDKKIINHSFYLQKASVQLKEVNISAEKQKQQTQIEISKITITQRDLKLIPTVGGEPDLIQYLQVLPGVVFSGDQGGQLVHPWRTTYSKQNADGRYGYLQSISLHWFIFGLRCRHHSQCRCVCWWF
jgi:hypothetical protein